MNTLQIIARNKQYNFIQYYRSLTYLSKLTLDELGAFIDELKEEETNHPHIWTAILMGAVKTNSLQRFTHSGLEHFCSLPAAQSAEILYYNYHKQSDKSELFTPSYCRLILEHEHPILIKNGLSILHQAKILNHHTFSKLLAISPQRLGIFVQTMHLLLPILNQDIYEAAHSSEALEDLYAALQHRIKQTTLTLSYFMILAKHTKPAYAHAVMGLLEPYHLAEEPFFNFIIQCIKLLKSDETMVPNSLKEEALLIDILHFFTKTKNDWQVYGDLLHGHMPNINEDKIATLISIKEILKILSTPNILTPTRFQILLNSEQPHYHAHVYQILNRQNLDQSCLTHMQKCLQEWDIPRANSSVQLEIERLLSIIFKRFLENNLLDEGLELLIPRYKRKGERKTLIDLKKLEESIQYLHGNQTLNITSIDIVLKQDDLDYSAHLCVVLKQNNTLTFKHFSHAEHCTNQWNTRSKEFHIEKALSQLYCALAKIGEFELHQKAIAQLKPLKGSIVAKLQQMTTAIKALEQNDLATELSFVLDTLESEAPIELASMMSLLYEVDELSQEAYQALKIYKKKNLLLKAMENLSNFDQLTTKSVLFLVKNEDPIYMSRWMKLFVELELDPFEYLDSPYNAPKAFHAQSDLLTESTFANMCWLFHKYGLDIKQFDLQIAHLNQKSIQERLKTLNDCFYLLSKKTLLTPMNIELVIQSSLSVYTTHMIMVLLKYPTLATQHSDWVAWIGECTQLWDQKRLFLLNTQSELELEIHLILENTMAQIFEMIVVSQPNLVEPIKKQLLTFFQKNAAYTYKALFQLKIACSVLSESNLLNESNTNQLFQHANILLFFLENKAFWIHLSAQKLTQAHLDEIFIYCSASESRSQKQTKIFAGVMQQLCSENHPLEIVVESPVKDVLAPCSVLNTPEQSVPESFINRELSKSPSLEEEISLHHSEEAEYPIDPESTSQKQLSRSNTWLDSQRMFPHRPSIQFRQSPRSSRDNLNVASTGEEKEEWYNYYT